MLFLAVPCFSFGVSMGVLSGHSIALCPGLPHWEHVIGVHGSPLLGSGAKAGVAVDTCEDGLARMVRSGDHHPFTCHSDCGQSSLLNSMCISVAA